MLEDEPPLLLDPPPLEPLRLVPLELPDAPLDPLELGTQFIAPLLPLDALLLGWLV
jgi:hypothetical protein